MKEFKDFWNMIYYYLYRWEVYTASLFNFPFLKLLENKKVIARFKKKGVDNPKKVFLNALNDKDIGFNSVLAARHMDILMMASIFAILNICSSIIPSFNFLEFFYHNFFIALVLVIVSAFVLNEFLVLDGEKSLGLFNKYSDEEKKGHRRNSIVVFLTILMIYTLCVLSFVFYIPEINYESL